MSSDFYPKKSELDTDWLVLFSLFSSEITFEWTARAGPEVAFHLWEPRESPPSPAPRSAAVWLTADHNVLLIHKPSLSDACKQLHPLVGRRTGGQQDLEEFSGSKLAFQWTSRRELGRKAWIQFSWAEPFEWLWRVLEFNCPWWKGMNLICFWYQKCYGYFPPKALLSEKGKKNKSEARSKISRSRKTENPVYPEHTPNKADTK